MNTILRSFALNVGWRNKNVQNTVKNAGTALQDSTTTVNGSESVLAQEITAHTLFLSAHCS